MSLIDSCAIAKGGTSNIFIKFKVDEDQKFENITVRPIARVPETENMAYPWILPSESSRPCDYEQSGLICPIDDPELVYSLKLSMALKGFINYLIPENQVVNMEFKINAFDSILEDYRDIGSFHVTIQVLAKYHPAVKNEQFFISKKCFE